MSHSCSPEIAERHPAYAAMRAFALSFPEAHEDFPWGHCAIKVRGKMFLSMAVLEEAFNFSLKLTDSNFEALLLPFTSPTRYGLGKSGWVSASFPVDQSPPLETVMLWIEESYRAVALKTLVKQLDASGGVAAFSKAGKQTKVSSRKKATKKKTTKRKATKKTVKKSAASKTSKASASRKKTAKKTTARKKTAKKKATRKKATKKTTGRTKTAKKVGKTARKKSR